MLSLSLFLSSLEGIIRYRVSSHKEGADPILSSTFLCLWNYTWKALRVDSSYLGDRGRPYVTLGVVQFFWQTISCSDFLSACSHPEVVLCLLCLLGDRAAVLCYPGPLHYA